jgi:hypothetical protein
LDPGTLKGFDCRDGFSMQNLQGLTNSLERKQRKRITRIKGEQQAMEFGG